MSTAETSTLITLRPALALAQRRPDRRPHFVLIGPKRVINLEYILEAEWRGKDLILTTVVQYTSPADGEQGPWLIFLRGTAADRAWAALTEATAQ
jgi:hypothetical protein